MNLISKNLIIEKDIGVGNITITSNEFQYLLQFNILEDIGKEMIGYKKNYEDLEKEINDEYQKNKLCFQYISQDYNPTLDKMNQNKNELNELIIQKYFPKWKEKNILQESIDRCDIHHIYHNYYRLEYNKNMNHYLEIIENIKNISENYKQILKNIKNYLECKDVFI
tara:strand:- start:570 stop:1070 length:501 start_codon:yes stop_codon:yes gene_type:complete